MDISWINDAVRRAPAFAPLALLAGCATMSGYPDRPANADNDVIAVKDYFESDVLQRYHAASADPRSGQTPQQYRDAVINGRLTAFDINYGKLVRALQGTDNGFAIGSDWAVLALNGIGATTGGVITKQALAAASAGIVGAKASIDKNLFYQKTLPALVAQMNASRAEVLVDIRGGLSKSTDEYPLEQAIQDTNRYYWAGTVMGAVTGVTKAAGASEARSTQQLQIFSQRNAAFKATYDQRGEILARINKLDDAGVQRLAMLMEQPLGRRSASVKQIVSMTDPANQRFTNSAFARAILRRWIVNEDGDAAAFEEWTAALANVEPGAK